VRGDGIGSQPSFKEYCDWCLFLLTTPVVTKYQFNLGKCTAFYMNFLFAWQEVKFIDDESNRILAYKQKTTLFLSGG
jgi:hypothetical protein